MAPVASLSDCRPNLFFPMSELCDFKVFPSRHYETAVLTLAQVELSAPVAIMPPKAKAAAKAKSKAEALPWARWVFGFF